MLWIFYSNTLAMAVAVGVSAAVLLGIARFVRWLISKRRATTKRRGLVSDAVREHLTLPATIMLALITAAMVAIVFLHQEILDSPDSAFTPWEAFRNIASARESALYLVYVGVAGLVFAGLAFVLDALSPPWRDADCEQSEFGAEGLERGFQVTARWAAFSAGLATVATVALVPAMLGLLMSVFQLPQDLPAGTATPSRPRAEAQANAPDGCSYLLPDGSEACSLLQDLGDGARVPCKALPIKARPLQLVGHTNPHDYPVARLAPHLVCTWTEPDTYVAGRTIPSGDLRAVNGTVLLGVCRFTVTNDAGSLVLQRSDYAEAAWGAYALIRLDPGDTILTGGCGWVPTQHAGLGVGRDGTIGVREHAGGWSHPLVVGVDIAPGWTQIECEFWTWDHTPTEIGSWAAALSEHEGQRHGPGLYEVTEGVVWPRC